MAKEKADRKGGEAMEKVYEVTLRVACEPGSTEPRNWFWPLLLRKQGRDVEVVSQREVREINGRVVPE